MSNNLCGSLDFCALSATTTSWGSGTGHASAHWETVEIWYSSTLRSLVWHMVVHLSKSLERMKWEGLKCILKWVFCKDMLMIKELSRKSSWPHFSWPRYINLIDFLTQTLLLPALPEEVERDLGCLYYSETLIHECRSWRKVMLKIISVWIPATELLRSRSVLRLQDNWMELEVCWEVQTSVCLMDRIQTLMGDSATGDRESDVRTGAVNISREGTAGWQGQLRSTKQLRLYQVTLLCWRYENCITCI